MTGEILVFDRVAVRHHRDRAAAALGEHDFLFREVASRLVDRLCDINRRFDLAVDLGAHGGIVRRTSGLDDRVGTLIGADLSPQMAARDDGPTIACDEEALPFANAALDLALSNLSLHWVNDLPGALAQIRRVLRPDGLFLGAIFGGDTLIELRHALMEAETQITGGVSPRLSPFADLADAAGLLQRAGFALPVADMDTITVTYGNAFALMRDLRGMGETAAALERPKGFSRRELFFAAVERYAALYGDAEGRIPATFQVLYLTGWAPAESQQRALRPGSAESRLADALDTKEFPAGEKAGD